MEGGAPQSPRGGTPGNAPGGGNMGALPRRSQPRSGRQPTNTGQSPDNTSTPTNALVGTQTTTARTPFGQQFGNIDKMGSDLFNNPDVLGSEFLSSLGIDPMHAGGMSKIYEDFANALPQLWLITQGMGSMGGGGGIPDFTNFVDYAGQALGAGGMPGASVLDPSAVGNALFNAPNDSAVYGFLNDPNADTSQQISALLGLLGGGLQNSIPSPVLSAIMGQAQEAGRQFLGNQAKQETPTGQTFADFLRGTTNLDEMLR
jgi:hypothetical protein